MINKDQTFEEFMADLASKPMSPFRPSAYLCEQSSEVQVYWANAQDYGDWLNNDVTIMREIGTEAIVGCRAYVEVTMEFVARWILRKYEFKPGQNPFPPDMLAWAKQIAGD